MEATFDIKGHNLEQFFEDNDLDYANEITIRRVITPAGKSRSFVDDMPVQLTLLRVGRTSCGYTLTASESYSCK